jgi:hypothetical protein
MSDIVKRLWDVINAGRIEDDHVRDLLREAAYEIEGLRAFKRGVDEALNSGDGSYRP